MNTVRFYAGITAVFLMIAMNAGAAVEPDQGSLGRFLKNCAWGTVIGAGAGVVSLAFENRPSDHTINIARGASLGLYGGIAYGLAEMNNPQKRQLQEDAFAFVPRFEKGQVSGLEMQGVLASF